MLVCVGVLDSHGNVKKQGCSKVLPAPQSIRTSSFLASRGDRNTAGSWHACGISYKAQLWWQRCSVFRHIPGNRNGNYTENGLAFLKSRDCNHMGSTGNKRILTRNCENIIPGWATLAVPKFPFCFAISEIPNDSQHTLPGGSPAGLQKG